MTSLDRASLLADARIWPVLGLRTSPYPEIDVELSSSSFSLCLLLIADWIPGRTYGAVNSCMSTTRHLLLSFLSLSVLLQPTFVTIDLFLFSPNSLTLFPASGDCVTF